MPLLDVRLNHALNLLICDKIDRAIDVLEQRAQRKLNRARNRQDRDSTRRVIFFKPLAHIGE